MAKLHRRDPRIHPRRGDQLAVEGAVIDVLDISTGGVEYAVSNSNRFIICTIEQWRSRAKAASIVERQGRRRMSGIASPRPAPHSGLWCQKAYEPRMCQFEMEDGQPCGPFQPHSANQASCERHTRRKLNSAAYRDGEARRRV